METRTIGRRAVLAAGTCALVASLLESQPASAHTETDMKSEQIIRKYYATWEHKDWSALDGLLASSFTFSSAAGDDHISKSAFKTQCWDTQSPYIAHFELLKLVSQGSDAFVMYVCHMVNGKNFRNVEFHRLQDGRVEAIECYFGAAAGYPTAVGAS